MTIYTELKVWSCCRRFDSGTDLYSLFWKSGIIFVCNTSKKKKKVEFNTHSETIKPINWYEKSPDRPSFLLFFASSWLLPLHQSSYLVKQGNVSSYHWKTTTFLEQGNTQKYHLCFHSTWKGKYKNKHEKQYKSHLMLIKSNTQMHC